MVSIPNAPICRLYLSIKLELSSNWSLILGKKKSGYELFFPNAGVSKLQTMGSAIGTRRRAGNSIPQLFGDQAVRQNLSPQQMQALFIQGANPNVAFMTQSAVGLKWQPGKWIMIFFIACSSTNRSGAYVYDTKWREFEKRFLEDYTCGWWSVRAYLASLLIE